jgi:cobalamin biosynthesis Mg chelatase CobN
MEQMSKKTDETETVEEQHDSTTSENNETNSSEQSIQSEIIDKTIETTEWSTPDSLGNQYVVKTTRTTTNIHREKRNDKQTNMLQTIDSNSKTAKHTRQTKSETTETKAYHSEQTKAKTPGWMHTTILGIIAIIFIVMLIILKRYHIL